MVPARILGVTALSILTNLSAFADCKAPPASYSIIDLGDFVENQTEAKVVAIGPDGRIIIRAIGGGEDDEYVEFQREVRGKYKPVKNTDDGATRETTDYLGNRVRLVDYTNLKPGYMPLQMETMIDRRGAETTVADFCKLPSEGAVLETFVISPSGLKSAGLFAADSGPVIAKCLADAPASVLFEAGAGETLVAINDAGQLAGLAESQTHIWRWTGDRRETGIVPEGLFDAEVDGIDQDGNIYATTVGQIKNLSLRYGIDGDVETVDVLPGLGWDLDAQVLGPCGELFGRAFHTELEAFLELPEDEQAVIRDDFDRYMAFASEREEGLFVWSQDLGGRLLSTIVPGVEDWIGLEIVDINRKGQAVGYAATEDGQIRALLFEPSKRR